ncbi:MAG: hypothetical protein ACYSOF_10740 [Planctomycetota bacterium]|jgi:hypothetical protein
MAKKTVKKWIMGVLIGLVALILIGAIAFKLFGDQLIRTMTIAGGEKALPFLKIGHIHANLNVSSLTSDTIEMGMIQLEDIHLVIEQKGKTNNLKEILNNLPKSESEDTEPEPKPEPAEDGASKNLRIKVLEINNIEVKAKLLPVPGRADTVTLKVKPIRLENLGTKEKINSADLTAKVLKAISKGITEQGADVLPKDMIGSIGDELGKQGGALLKGTQDLGKSTSDALKDLGGLFKKKEEDKE